MIKPNVLIIADKADEIHLDSNKKSENWNLFWLILNYNKLNKQITKIQGLINAHQIDFILYSRNDQVAKKLSIGPVTRELAIGYSSFSGIDEKYRINEMKTCFNDFLNCNPQQNIEIPLPSGRCYGNTTNSSTYSLLFDTEQLGGVRYGLPRILKLLNKYNVKATFFVTNLMHKIYPNIITELTNAGHEIGLHGKWHEYMSTISKNEQTNQIKEMISDFKCQIHSANFVGRMNDDTISSLIENGIEYVVYPLINSYKLFSYPKLTTNLFSLNTESGSIIIPPISVETYGRPWFSIRNMIDSAFRESFQSNRHITILCHPFRDGNLQNIHVFEKLLRYLIINMRMRASPLKDLSHHSENSIKIHNIDQITPKIGVSNIIPRTKQDLFGMIPENLVMLYRLMRRKTTVW